MPAAYLGVLGVVEGPSPQLEVPPLPSLEGTGLLQKDPLLHTFLEGKKQERERGERR